MPNYRRCEAGSRGNCLLPLPALPQCLTRASSQQSPCPDGETEAGAHLPCPMAGPRQSCLRLWPPGPLCCGCASCFSRHHGCLLQGAGRVLARKEGGQGGLWWPDVPPRQRERRLPVGQKRLPVEFARGGQVDKSGPAGWLASLGSVDSRVLSLGVLGTRGAVALVSLGCLRCQVPGCLLWLL